LAGVTINENKSITSNDGAKAAPIIHDIRKRKGLKLEVPDSSHYIDKLWETRCEISNKIFFKKIYFIFI